MRGRRGRTRMLDSLFRVNRCLKWKRCCRCCFCAGGKGGTELGKSGTEMEAMVWTGRAYCRSRLDGTAKVTIKP